MTDRCICRVISLRPHLAIHLEEPARDEPLAAKTRYELVDVEVLPILPNHRSEDAVRGIDKPFCRMPGFGHTISGEFWVLPDLLTCRSMSIVLYDIGESVSITNYCALP